MAQISLFMLMFFIGSIVLQSPIGWLSDPMDRWVLICAVAALMGAGGVSGFVLGGVFVPVLVTAFIIGGMANPLYSLLIAYANDFLDYDDMAAAAGGMVFINGLGAVTGPLITGWLMGVVGPQGFFVVIVVLSLSIAAYAAYRMTQRAALGQTDSYMAVSPSASPMEVAFAKEVAIETAQEAEDAAILRVIEDPKFDGLTSKLSSTQVRA